MVSGAKIGIILPARETFGLRKSGAIALCMRDFARFSRFADKIEILGSASCEYTDVRYARIENWRRWWLRQRTAYARAVIREAKARGYRVLEVQNRPYMIPTLRRALPDVKLALHLHNDPQTMDGARSPGQRRELLRQCDAIYCVSRFIRDRFLSGINDDWGRAHVAYNGVESQIATAPKERIVAFAGRVIEIKGVVELINAFAGADLPDWKLVVAGDDPDGLLSGPRSPAAFAAASLGSRLELRGQVSHAEAMNLFASAEIAAVPSIWDDPCPRSAIEALANGCALIATKRGGLAEIAEGAGIFVDPADTAEFAIALRRIARDDSWRATLQARAISKARDMFDIRAVTHTLDEVRESLLASP